MAISHILVAKSILGTAAVWRQYMPAAHPNDKRNARASKLRELLSAEPVANIPGEIITKLDGYCILSCRVAMQTGRQVGFRIFSGSLVAFLQEVMNRIDESWQELDRIFPSSTKQEGA